VEWDAPLEVDHVETQLRLLQSANTQSDRGIIFTPDETLAPRSFVLDSVRKHIPVVVIDDEFGPPPGSFLSYVSNDETIGTRFAAQRLAKDLHGRGSVVIVGFESRHEGSVSREGLLERALSEYAPGIKITSRQFGDTVITRQQQICQQLLNTPHPPDAILALSSAATRGAYYAKIASPHRLSTIIIGFDQDVTLPIRTGDIDAVVMQDTHTLGQDAARNILAQLKGVTVPSNTVVAPVLVTRDNIDSPEVERILSLKGTANAKVSPLKSENGHASAHDIEAEKTAFLHEAKMHEVQPGVESIGSFIRTPGIHRGATIQGMIISLPPMLGVQDDTAAAFIWNFTPQSPIKLGDVVAVHGDLMSDRFRARMENATIRVLWSERPIPPLAVTASQLTDAYRGKTIEVEGNVVSETTTPDGIPDFVLQDQGHTFRSLVYGPSDAKLPDFAPGTRIRVRGTATSLLQFTKGIYPFTVIGNKVEFLSPPPWWSPAHIVLLTIAILALLLGIQWVLHIAELWHMRSVLQEREQLAFEMHDTLAQCFTGIAYQLHAARAERNGEDAVQSHIEHALAMVATSHREASRTIAALRPQHRDAPGILAALKLLAEKLGAGGDLIIHTTMTGRSSELRLETADAFFRIGQEAISNAIQHGHCKTLSVELQFDRRKAALKVSDDGIGFSTLLEPKGLGIIGMRRRSEKIRATFSLTSTPGHGTTVMIVCSFRPTSSMIQSLRTKLNTTLRRKATA
jgi:ribose transport system substrate-binding protein